MPPRHTEMEVPTPRLSAAPPETEPLLGESLGDVALETGLPPRRRRREAVTTGADGAPRQRGSRDTPLRLFRDGVTGRLVHTDAVLDVIPSPTSHRAPETLEAHGLRPLLAV